MRTARLLAPALVFALAGLAGLGLDAPVVNDWLLRASLLVLLTTSWNLMANAGLISLGHSAFFGAGLYATVLLANGLHAAPLLALPGASLCGALLGAILAVATGRLRGIFFAISTLALSEGLRVIAFMLPDVTGGASGIFVDGPLRVRQATVVLVGVLLAAGALALLAALGRTPLQFASRAMRNNENAAQMLGIDPRRFRLVILAISGAVASLAGGLSIAYTSYTEPDAAFSMEFTILPQIAALTGGLYGAAGSGLGAVVIVALQELTRSFLGGRPGVSLATFGVLLILCVLYLPHGIAGFRPARSRRGRAATALAP